MKIYAITFLAVAGLTFSFATAPLDTLYWLLFALELPSAVAGLIGALLMLAVGLIAIAFPPIAIILFAFFVDELSKGAGR